MHVTPVGSARFSPTTRPRVIVENGVWDIWTELTPSTGNGPVKHEAGGLATFLLARQGLSRGRENLSRLRLRKQCL